jgi:hypothetical protein
VQVEAVAGEHPLDSPEDFWDIVLGSGYRATVDALAPDERETLRSTLLARLSEQAVSTVRTDVVYGTAERRRAT